MDVALGSFVLEAISILQNLSGGRAQGRMAEDLRTMREIMERQFGVADPAYLLAPQELWSLPYRELPQQAIVFVTGCHLYSEMFDRPIAYGLKLALDRARGAHETPSSVVMSDIWLNREPSLGSDRVVLSIGGPRINMITGQIIQKGAVVRRGTRWQIVRDGRRYAIFGDDPADTLQASQQFVRHELTEALSAAPR